MKITVKKQKTECAEMKNRIIDCAPMSIITIDTEGYITFVNRYFRNFSNSKKSVGRNISNIPFFVRENLLPEYRNLFAEGRPFNKRYCKTQNSEGEIKYLNIVAVPLKDKKGKIDGALSMAVDVTPTVLAKMELKRLNDSLEEEVIKKTSQLMEANKSLEKSLALKAQFISDASHELRTPLAIAKLNLEFFMNQLSRDNAKRPSELEAANYEIDKICEILADLSLITSIDEGVAGKIKKDRVDLNELMEKSIKRLETFSNKKNINIIWQKNIANSFIEGDGTKLETVFTNIIRNALKYGQKNGWVKIWLEPNPEKNNVMINISDNGIGIPKKDLPHIFDRFYRTDLSIKSAEGGFGLGLAICKWIVSQHGGGICVKSTVGKGSLFAINLPMEQNC